MVEQEFVWSFDDVAETLGAAVCTYPHPSWGKEQRLSVKKDRELLYQLLAYPERLMAVYRDKHLCLTMHRVCYLGVDRTEEGQVRVETASEEARTTFTMNARGEIYFTRTPVGKEAVTPVPEPEPAKPEVAGTGKPEPTASEAVAGNGSPGTAVEKKDRDYERLTMTGRLAPKDKDKGLHIKETKSGKRVLEVLLGVREDGQEKPIWFTVAFTDKFADSALPRLQAYLDQEKRPPITLTVLKRQQERNVKLPNGSFGKKVVDAYYGVGIGEPKKK